MSEHDPFRIARLILDMRQNGVTNTRLLQAIETTPREHFVPEGMADDAYEDVALPIACGQTTSRPTAVAGMIDALELGEEKTLTVLEIGTGSGFMTALIGRLSRRVYSMDRYRTLVDGAKARFEHLGITNAITTWGDGAQGWPAAAPFDRIISTCAVEEVPDVWVDQLKPGGVMIIPVGTNEEQHFVRIRKGADDELATEPLAPSKFLHLVPGISKHL